MENVTLGLAILLGVGFVAAKLCQFLRLPSVTGYICTGLFLGPSGLNIFHADFVGERLQHFTQIALMLIAFSIGELLEIKQLKKQLKELLAIGFSEAISSFLFVLIGFVTFLSIFSFSSSELTIFKIITLSVLLGSISVATAPASTLLVMRELKACGPLAKTLMTVVAIDNSLAIIFFGISLATIRNLIGVSDTAIYLSILYGFLNIGISILLGVLTGLLLDLINNKLSSRSEMLIFGLALLLISGESARIFELSPLLTGMAAGFTIVNRDRRDVRVFRLLNNFEAPIYVLFFTLAGTHLDISTLKIAGWLGFLYFVFRFLGKTIGSKTGAILCSASFSVQRYLGLALIPQAGVAIGLLFLVTSDPSLVFYSNLLTPIVLSSVVLSELIGPVFARKAVVKSGEALAVQNFSTKFPALFNGEAGETTNVDGITLVPWTWEKLIPSSRPKGRVIFGVSLVPTVSCLARFATLLAHYYEALPMALRVVESPADNNNESIDDDTLSQNLFSLAKQESRTLGYDLDTYLIHSDDVAFGILNIAAMPGTKAVFLGHPLEGSVKRFNRIIEKVANEVACPILIIRFFGTIHTERILVPLTSSDDLNAVQDIILALSRVGNHNITLLRLFPSAANETEIEQSISRIDTWVVNSCASSSTISTKFLSCDSWLEAIETEAQNHDLIVMASFKSKGIKKVFFGSLAEDVAQAVKKTLIIVFSPKHTP